MPESNYFRLCRPRGRGKIKDTYKIIKHLHRFWGELVGSLNSFGTKLRLIGVQSSCLLSVTRFLCKGKKFVTFPKAHGVKKYQKHSKFKACFLVYCDIKNGLLIKKVDASLGGWIN
jgi:hypothetical protein